MTAHFIRRKSRLILLVTERSHYIHARKRSCAASIAGLAGDDVVPQSLTLLARESGDDGGKSVEVRLVNDKVRDAPPLPACL
jgi:hypothetical protein